MTTMTVGKLAESTGINIETVRFYEREGLLPKPERSAGGHRLYDADDVARLRFIQRAKDVGFTLKEIQDLLFLRTSDLATCGDVSELATRKLNEITRKIELLTEMREHLADLIERCPGGDKSTQCCSILQGIEGGSAKAAKGKKRSSA